MTQRALRALKKSIKHWTRIAEGNGEPGEGMSCADCALCCLFTPKGGTVPNCTRCPVMQRTGLAYCRATPHGEAMTAYERRLRVLVKRADIPESLMIHRRREAMKSLSVRRAAAVELEFLKSLLPPEPQPVTEHQHPNRPKCLKNKS